MFVRDAFVGNSFLVSNIPIRKTAVSQMTSNNYIVSTTEGVLQKSVKRRGRGPSTTTKLQKNKENHSPGIQIVLHKYIHNYFLCHKAILQFQMLYY